MSIHTVVEAESRLSDLIDLALAGEGVVITRDGRPVVELKPIAETGTGRAMTAADLEWLRVRRVGTKMPRENAAELVRRMRDEGY